MPAKATGSSPPDWARATRSASKPATAFTETTSPRTPLEAGLGWVVKLDKGDFIGREALQQVKEEGPSRKLVGFVMEERGIPRHDQAILDPEGHEIGVVTSGTQSPILEEGIGLGYVPNDSVYTEPGSHLAIRSRGRPRMARVQKPPFHKND